MSGQSLSLPGLQPCYQPRACRRQAVRRMLERARAELGLDVYAYSVFHVFFEQYLNVGAAAARLLLLAGAGVTAAVAAFTSSVWAAGLAAGVLASLLLHLLAVMVLWGVQLNAVRRARAGASPAGARLPAVDAACADIMHCWIHRPGRPAVAQAYVRVGACAARGVAGPAACSAAGWRGRGGAPSARAPALACLTQRRAHGRRPRRAQVSLVNLAMALGIGVEFVAHVLHAFLASRAPGRPARAAAALRAVGASVLSGITLTKLAGARAAGP